MANAIDKIKKLHSAMSIERKDITLQDLVSNEADKNGNAIIEVKGMASKFVAKYHNDTNAGYHTMIYLRDGRKTGGFSNALYELATFFYQGAGMDTNSHFNKIEFSGEGFIKIQVAKVKLDGGKSTYNFEILDGEVTSIIRMGQVTGEAPLLIEE